MHSQLNLTELAPWLRALTLDERLVLLRDSHTLARNRDRRGLNQASEDSHTCTDDDRLLRARLEAGGASRRGIDEALSVEPEDLAAALSEKPAWLRSLIDSVDRPRPRDLSLALPSRCELAAPMLRLIGRLVATAKESVATALAALQAQYPQIEIEADQLLVHAVGDLGERVLSLIQRPIVVEFQHLRLTSAERSSKISLEEFYEALSDRSVALSVLRRYPVLARLLVAVTQQWSTTTVEAVRRYCRDHHALKSLQHSSSTLSGLARMGDYHNGGRAVLLFRFSDNTRLVYKPRSLSVDTAFQRLLCWLNDNGAPQYFRPISVLDEGTYGWVEHVRVEACSDKEAVSRFYRNLGGYLALLHILQSTDIHYQNVIASGDHPVIVDLETLFQPHIHTSSSSSQSGLSIRNSVFRVGILPMRASSRDDRTAVDVSALTGPSGELTPFSRPSLVGLGDGDLRIEMRPLAVSAGQNRPSCSDYSIDPSKFAEPFAQGFADLYDFLLRQRSEVLATHGPMAGFRDARVRAILRPTRLYDDLLHDMLHPSNLRDAVSTERCLQRLWTAVDHNPLMEACVRAEIAELQRGDIPLLMSSPSSRSIWSIDGECAHDVLAETAYEACQRRLGALCSDDLEFQLRLIRTSFSCVAGPEARAATVMPRQNTTISEDLESLVRSAADSMVEAAFRQNGETFWVGLRSTPDGHWSLSETGLDLYDGNPGIALFLAYAGERLHNETYTGVAEEALRAVQRRSKDQVGSMTIGGFDGLGGLVYLFTHLGCLWSRRELLFEAEELVKLMATSVASDGRYDVISGAAGGLLAAASLWRATASRQAREVVRLCAERLLNVAIPTDGALGWKQNGFSGRPLAGFAHGTSGIGLALWEAFLLTGDRRFERCARGAWLYEKLVFSPDQSNWPDFRALPGQPDRCMAAWCHGAPGIGYSRIRLRRLLGTDWYDADLRSAVAGTKLAGNEIGQCLCHGLAGNSEFLSEASLELGESWVVEARDQAVRDLVRSARGGSWLCGPANRQTACVPGLMTGVSGVGFGVLRLLFPTSTPGVLMLEPPLQSGESKTGACAVVSPSLS